MFFNASEGALFLHSTDVLSLEVKNTLSITVLADLVQIFRGRVELIGVKGSHGFHFNILIILI
jgi:hypothetical protein